MMQHAPQPCVVFTDQPGGRGDWHGADQGHDQSLKQQGEAAVRTGPGHHRLLHAATVATNPRHARVKERLMLEEIEMPPGLRSGVVDRTVSRAA